MDDQNGPARTAVQMRIGFQGPTRSVSLHLDLSGLTVLIDADGGMWDDAWKHLSAVGVRVRPHQGGGLAFDVGELGKLADLPVDVTVHASEDLAALWELALDAPSPGTVARIEVVGRDLRMRWVSAAGKHDVACRTGCHGALLGGEVPFVAAGDAWMELRKSSSLPVVAGKAHVSRDRFIEIATTRPQLIEGSPVPGLFKINDSLYGAALRFADSVRGTAGITWEGHAPVEAPQDLYRLVEWSGGGVAVGDPAAQRRFVREFQSSSGAGPVLVVAAPWSLWAWRTSDGWVRSYDEIADDGVPGDAGLVVFDDPVAADRGGADVHGALKRLAGVRDVIRIAVTTNAPEANGAGMLIGACARPSEFDPDASVVLRYPAKPDERMREHLDSFVFRLSEFEHGQTGAGVSVRRVEVSSAVALDLARARWEGDAAEVWNAVDAALAAPGGPWFAGALQAISEHPNDRVAVCVPDVALAHSIAAGLRPRKVEVLDEDGPPKPATRSSIFRFRSGLPEAEHPLWARFDRVVICGSLCGFGSLLNHVDEGRSVEVVLASDSPDELRAHDAALVGSTRRLTVSDIDEYALNSAMWPDPHGGDGW